MWVADETLRKAKNDLFNMQEELKDVIKDENARKDELDYNNKEVESQQTKLNHLNNEIDELSLEQKEIQE